MSLRRAVAFHEAAHCAAALALGYRVTEARLHVRGGETRFTQPNNTHDAAVIAAAGTVAQMRVAPDSPITMSDDAAIVAESLDRGAWRDADRLVDEFWPLIQKIASELLERGQLEFTQEVARRLGLVLNREPPPPKPIATATDSHVLVGVVDKALTRVADALDRLSAPREIVRDAKGRATGVRVKESV
jgi:hypothetical protein